MEIQKKGYCIICRAEIRGNLPYPYCKDCDQSCSSFDKGASSVMPAYYCHYCGEESYISDENPLCYECKNLN